ncbi:MAG TPA: hypothetical protein VKV04_12985 [Verrucomicrobiae bacterium]|nr:hypothetical protein [Verrucomicrobiae bacterium]
MPQTVIYHVRPGSEHQLQAVLSETWQIYLKEGMVHADPHVLVKVREDETRDCFIEVFTWTGCFAMEHPSATVQSQISKIEPLCEARKGSLAIEFRDTQMFAPRLPKVAE